MSPQRSAKSGVKHLLFHLPDSAVRVKVGFSWPALFFGTLWAITKRMWLPYVPLMLLAEVGLWALTGWAEAAHLNAVALAGALASLGYAWLRGHYGNRWLAASLRRRGYALLNPGIP